MTAALIPEGLEPIAVWVPMEDMTPAELDAVIRGYTDRKLAELYQSAAKYPGTEWHRLLSDEIGRRDALGRG